jgi:ABC-type lipoprotein export system ATPase subunit
VLQVEELRKHYANGPTPTRALDGVSFTASPGELLVVYGASGSGKSTLLLMAGGMLSPTSGKVSFRGADVYGMSRRRRNAFRGRSVGFLFQKFYLMPYLTVYDNVRLPLALRRERHGVRDRITRVCERLQIAERLEHRPSELSVGEQQRVAMARTLAAEPELILADEPTGNLDKANGDIIAQCLLEEKQKGRLILLATHDESLIELGDRRLHIEAGRLAE